MSVDAYWEAALEKGGLQASPVAPPHAILRRLHDVLTGLPPEPDEIRSFMAGIKDGLVPIIEKTVDKLLASPHFGERWARHWLDVARYADVNGATNPASFPEAWRYRQWVVHAFNADKRWDDFVREQIAGDLLSTPNSVRQTEQSIATGFLALPHVLAIDRDKERLKLDTIDEQLDVIGRTFLGIQIGCARCHDHKIDPFPATDYYAMAGILRSTDLIRASPLQPEQRAIGKGVPFWMRGQKSLKIHSARDLFLRCVIPIGWPSERSKN